MRSMIETRAAVVWILTVVVAFALGAVLFKVGMGGPIDGNGSAASKDVGEVSGLKVELSEITINSARAWESRRSDFAEGSAEWKEARKQHQKNYARAIRDAHERHDSTPPDWATVDVDN